MRIVVLLVLTGLAGCAQSDAYPDGFLLQERHVPQEFDLMRTSHAAWPALTEAMDMETNPGEVSKGLVAELLQVGLVESAHATVLTDGHADGANIVGFAFQFRTIEQRLNWLESKAINLCLEGTFTMTKGLHGAAIMGLGANTTTLRNAAESLARANGAQLACTGDGPPSAVPVGIGTHGPFSIEDRQETDWYTMTSDGPRTIRTESRGDTEMWIYGADMELLAYNDDGPDQDAIISGTFDGDIWIRIQSFDQRSEIREYMLIVEG